MYQKLVMPLKNGTQKDLKLGPDFRRDDGRGWDDGRGRDDGRVRDALNIAIIKSASKNLILIIVKFINFYE